MLLHTRLLSPSFGYVRQRFLACPCIRCFSTIRTDLERWQRRSHRLTQLQRAIRFLPVQAIPVDGKDVKLPLPAVEAARSPSQGELAYLVGFFDGDGCVSMKKETGEMRLSIGQNVNSAEVLLHFRSLLGGSVCRQSASTGSKRAKVQWRVCGSKMTAAAETLSRVPSIKRAQLLLAIQGTIPKNNRATVAGDLQVFKQRQHVPDQRAECSWSYFAGFFDAEGSILICPTSTSLRLEVKQVNPCMLVHLLRFLGENRLQGWSLHHHAYSALVCNNLRDCKQTLELLIANGLLVKGKQAELDPKLHVENHLRIRDAISSLKGLQGRYTRLDKDDIARAREIQSLRMRLRYISAPEQAALLSQIEKLRAEHNLQKLITRCSLLRKDLRQSLRQGGQVVSPINCYA